MGKGRAGGEGGGKNSLGLSVTNVRKCEVLEQLRQQAGQGIGTE